MTCRVCGHQETTPRFAKDGVEILRCANCAVEFWLPEASVPVRDFYGRKYFEGASAAGYEDYRGLEPALRRSFARRLRTLGPGDGRRLLDVGAAYGFALDEARRAGFEAFGLEVAGDVAAEAATRANGHIFRANAAALPLRNASCDVVTLWDVLEHLEDPGRALLEAARCLRRGGRLMLTTGDVTSIAARVSGRRWHLYTIPEHLFFFSPQGLRILLAKAGLEVREMRADGAYYSLSYLAERLRKTIFGLGLRRTVSRTPRDLSVYVNLGDILLVDAVRS